MRTLGPRYRSTLPSRYQAVLELVAEGRTNVQIATQLKRTRITVVRDIYAMRDRYGAVSRTHLVTCAFRAGDLK